MANGKDTAGIIAPPPLIALAAVLAGLALDWLFPAFVLTLILTFAERIVIGVVLIVGGLSLGLPALGLFVRSGTNVNPFKPSTALVTSGIFGYVRNPMYVGMALLVAGLGIALASDWTLVMLVIYFLLIHFGVIKREERYLEAKFGDNYRQYMARVPRYGMPG